MAQKLVLQTELEYFEKIRDELVQRSKGEYALIRGEKLIDVFVSKEDAIRRGYELFGNSPFLVKQIFEIDMPIFFTSNLISLRTEG